MSLDLGCPFCGAPRSTPADPCPRCDVTSRAPVSVTADLATPTVWGTADVELTDADGAWAPEELELARPPVAARPPRVDAPPTHGEEQPYVLVLADDLMDAHFHDEETEEQAARTGATLVTLGLDALRPRAPDGAAGAAPRVEPDRSFDAARVEPARSFEVARVEPARSFEPARARSARVEPARPEPVWAAGDGRSSDAARGDGAAGAGRTGGLGAQVQAQAGPGSGSPPTDEGAEPWLGDRPTIARLEPTIRLDLASLVSLVERAVPALAGLCVAAALGLSLVAAHEAAVGETELGQALRARVHAEAATPVENRRYRGERCAWELELMVLKPWVARDHASVERDNPRVERWLSRPEADAHVVVFAEPLAEGTIADLDDVRSVILGDANVGFDAFELVTESAGPRAATLEARATVEGRRFVQLHRVVSAPGCIVHVVGFAPESRELEVGDELRRILDTVKLAAPRKADRIQRSSETARSTRS